MAALEGADSSQIQSCEVALYSSGTFGSIARSRCFRIGGLVVTTFFMIWAGIEVDMNDAAIFIESQIMFQTMALIFILFFTAEAAVRFLALREKSQIWKCPGLIWDMCLDLLLIIPVIVNFHGTPYFRLLRLFFLLQLTRQFRVLWAGSKDTRKALSGRHCPVIRGLIVELLIFCFLMVLSLLYIFSIVMRKTTYDTDAGEHFTTVPVGMISLVKEFGIAESLLSSQLYFAFSMYLVFLVLVVTTVMITITALLKQMLMRSKAEPHLKSEAENEPQSQTNAAALDTKPNNV